jgi:hypothetical protein
MDFGRAFALWILSAQRGLEGLAGDELGAFATKTATNSLDASSRSTYGQQGRVRYELAKTNYACSQSVERASGVDEGVGQDAKTGTRAA